MGLCFSINRESRRLLRIQPDSIDKRTFAGSVRTAMVHSIYDGDTITIITRLHSGEPYAKYNLRLSGLDAPEVKPRLDTPDRELHKQAGIAVRDYLMRYIPVGSLVQVAFEKEEKYGRLLGTVHKLEYRYIKYIPTQNVNQHLVDLGLVKPYKGAAKDTFDRSTLERIISKCTY